MTTRLQDDASYDLLRIAGTDRYLAYTSYIGDAYRAARDAGVAVEPLECVFGVAGSRLLAAPERVAAVDPTAAELAALAAA